MFSFTLHFETDKPNQSFNIMAENKRALKRYFIIDELLRRRPGSCISIEDMMEAIQDRLDFSISERSLKGDLEFMKNDPGMKAPIANKRGEGYFYTNNKFRLQAPTFSNDDVQSIRQALSLLKNYSQLGLPATFATAVNKLNLVMDDSAEDNFVLLDHNESYRGARHLEPLFNAIKDGKAVRFKYNKFDEEEKVQTFRVASPLVLKEYMHIWYVLMYNPEKDTYRNYALDRMNFVEIDPQTKYIRPKGFSARKYYQYTMGITVDNNSKPDLIKLKVYKPLLHYIVESPWHETQQIDIIDAESAIVTLKVYLGSELFKEIMSWGASVQVLEPKLLRDRMKKQISGLQELYS